VSDCLFCKIVEGRIPAKKVYEDEDILAFNDINPARPVHVLVIPKKHITSLATAAEDDTLVLGKMLARANEIAPHRAVPDGFRVIINTGRVGQQEVPHLHIAYRGRTGPGRPHAQTRLGDNHGQFFNLALADRSGHRDADFRHQEAA
jgi:histidine triad (HIT) family protein